MKETPHPPIPLGKSVDEALRSIPVVRVAYEMFKHPTKEGDLLLVTCSTVLMVALLLIQVGGPYDTDGWFLLSSGKYIMQNGIPYENPWAIDAPDGEYAIVIQQWLHDCILYEAYSAFGYHGVDAVAVIVSGIFFIVLYATVRIVSGKASPASCYAACTVAIIGCTFYMSVRPTMWTMMCVCLVVAVCKTAAQRNIKKLYALLPVIMLFHAQVHMSMMWLDVFAAACFLLPDNLADLKHLPSHLRKKLPLIAAIAAMAVASCINPYGIDGALYLFSSYGAAGYRNVISELGSALPLDAGVLVHVFLAIFIILPIAFMVQSRKLPLLPCLLIWMAGTLSFMLNIRSIWIAAIGATLVIASFLKPETQTENATRLAGRRANAFLPAVGGICVALAMAFTAATAPQDVSAYVDDDPDADGFSYGICGWEQGEKDVGPIAERIASDPDKGRVYVSWEILNSFLEWKDVQVMFDTRPEVWEPGITKAPENHPWREFVDSVLDDDGIDAYIHAHDWKWYIVTADLKDAFCENYNLQVELDNGMYVLLRNAD